MRCFGMPCCARAASGHAAAAPPRSSVMKLAPSEIEHGLLPGTRCASLQQAEDAREAPAGPWGGPESF